ncbi:MAG: hypothetical protein Q7T42_01690 [Methylotenera sp.]|jgi:hypothetical protein|uniref:hypothetical protein n=1 Tax=Methylotenera sp. TaxID=2051956 RepID=UPI00271A712B|nr:hypothetical protein [Methylotenera sp.]MDO9392677.1 hypothetical protein [Methylotenera sp.]MDP1522033.1 hypothetical protein [Methylotenera sp.]
MKRLMIVAAVVTAALSTPVLAADVGVSVSIGQPGFYGRIDIGDYPYPQPRVIYTQPRVVERVYIEREPIYMRVPPGHAKNWRKHCHKYNACGERVYFVQDNWYNQEFAPRYREQHRGYQNDRHDGYRDDNRGKQKNNHPGKGHDRGRNH